MIDLRQAAETVLEALEMNVLGFNNIRKIELAIEALESALAKPDETETLKRCLFQMQEAAKALAEPQKWVHLLTDEKEDIRKSVDYSQFMSVAEYACKVQDATEAKLKELNHE